MTNLFDVACERLEREENKPDMVEVIADKLVEDHISLLVENSKLRKDAERYRWLRKGGIDHLLHGRLEKLDAAIDAAMKEGK